MVDCTTSHSPVLAQGKVREQARLSDEGVTAACSWIDLGRLQKCTLDK